jgi:TonB-linked SusC/RagA family outer membrane protein
MKKLLNRIRFNKPFPKFDLKMKLTVLFLLTTLSVIHANDTYSQKTKLSLNATNLEVFKVIEKIETATGLRFIYNIKSVNLDRTISINAKNENIPIKNEILISPIQKQVKGKVTNEKGEPISGANVQVKGSPVAVQTGFDGSFTIDVPAKITKLVVSFVGMVSQEVTIGKDPLTIVLVEEGQKLEDVVVVGFGKQRKVSVTGSITTVKPKDLKIPSSNLSNSFAGRIAGMTAVQRSGEPGADGSNFWIRGISTFAGPTSPLIFLDGVEISSGDMNGLPSEVIESFSVLKDASATALYGARGANGVLLITTKSGRANEKALVNVRVQTTYSQPTQMLELSNAEDYMRLKNEAMITRAPGSVPRFSEDYIAKVLSGEDQYLYPNVDWQNLLFKEMSINQLANLNVSGGSKAVTYFLSGSINKDDGMLRQGPIAAIENTITNTRYSFQGNIAANITSTTKVGLRINSQIRDYNGPSASMAELYQGVFEAPAVIVPAFIPGSKGENHVLFGNKLGGPKGGGTYLNPYSSMVNGMSSSSASTSLVTFDVNQNLDFMTKGLSFSALASFKNYSFSNVEKFFTPYFYEITGRDSNGKLEYISINKGSQALSSTFANSGERHLNFQASFNYNRIFKDVHEVGAMFVYLQREYNINNPSSLLNSLPTRNQGVAGRLTYGYDLRYLVELNFGYNGSDNFAKGSRYGFFPSVSVGYNISKEKFFEPLLETVNNLKIRASYGLVGNSFTSPRFPYLTEVNLAGRGYTFGDNWGSTLTGGTVTKIGVPTAQWEVGEKSNLGIDIQLFKSLNITADVFREIRDKIFLARQTIPAETGITIAQSPMGNLGKVKNQGFDISLDYNKFLNKDWSFSVKGTFTYAKNTLLDRDEPEYPFPNMSDVGHSLNMHRGLVSLGLFKDQADIDNSPVQTFGLYQVGDVKYQDVNGDGVISDLDNVRLGSPTVPVITYGMGASVNYKKLDFSVFFQGIAQTSLMMSDIHPYGGVQRNLLSFIPKDYWSEANPNPNAAYPRLTDGPSVNNQRSSDYWLRDASFVRLKNMEVGYTLRSARFSLSGQNLLTFSSFKHWDPETGGGNGLSYPPLKVVAVGFQYSF